MYQHTKAPVGLKKVTRMADDREVLRAIWEGKLPVSFQLAADEVHTLNVPDPFYLMVPRLLLFPLVTDKVRKHFIQHIHPDSANKEMWFEYNGQPVKWHYPIGLWFDLNAHDTLLPWTITVHFEDYPETKILHCSSRDAVRSNFISMVKEADSLKHKGQVINSMQEKDHHQLWLGFQNDRFDQFWGINKKLMESSGEGFHNIPIRVYTPDNPLMQRLVKPFNTESSSWVTLNEAILNFIPDFDSSKHRLIIHGFDVPLDTPIQWLSEHLSYPDNFLHLVCLAFSASS